METEYAKWVITEETPEGRRVVEAYTDAEMAAMESMTTESRGICVDLATMPEKSIIDEVALARILRVTTRTIRRMVQRHEIPPPVNLAGKSVWFAGNILSHIQTRVDRSAKDAERRYAARMRLTA